MDLIKLFIKMVKIDSESGNEDRFAKFCVDYLKKIEFSVRTDKFGNIIAYNYRSKERSPLLLSAHLDTVSPGENIKPVIEKGIIKSSGKTILGADNKLAIAIYFDAIRQLQTKQKIRPIEIVLTRKEELGMMGARNLDFSKIKAKEGISLDAEGDVHQYISSAPYAEIFNIEIIGKAAHASIPENGIDALKIFSLVYSKIETGRINKNSTVNFGIISGGDGNNTVIDKIVVEGNIRSQEKRELEMIKKEIDIVFHATANKYHGKAKIKFTKVIDGYRLSKTDSIIQSIEKSIKHKLIPEITNSGSDANIFHDRGIKIVELCHGIKYTHTTNERIPINTMKKISTLVYRIITSA